MASLTDYRTLLARLTEGNFCFENDQIVTVRHALGIAIRVAQSPYKVLADASNESEAVGWNAALRFAHFGARDATEEFLLALDGWVQRQRSGGDQQSWNETLERLRVAAERLKR